MKTLKKLFIILLALGFVFSFASCKKDADDGNNNGGTEQQGGGGNEQGGGDNNGGNGGGGSTTATDLAPFAGTTWESDVEGSENPITFKADGTVESEAYCVAMEGVTYKYTVTKDGDKCIAIVESYMDGVIGTKVLKFVIPSADATSGAELYTSSPLGADGFSDEKANPNFDYVKKA